MCGVFGRGDARRGDDELVTRELALASYPGGGEPDERMPPVDGAQRFGDELQGPVGARDVCGFVGQHETQACGVPCPRGRRQEDRRAAQSPCRRCRHAIVVAHFDQAGPRDGRPHIAQEPLYVWRVDLPSCGSRGPHARRCASQQPQADQRAGSPDPWHCVSADGPGVCIRTLVVAGSRSVDRDDDPGLGSAAPVRHGHGRREGRQRDPDDGHERRSHHGRQQHGVAHRGRPPPEQLDQQQGRTEHE